MKFLIAGGAGFIGSNLCKKLVEMKHHVLCVDNFATSNSKNISELNNNKYFSFINHDIINKIDFELDVDGIFNLACPASPDKYQLNPINTLKTSFLGTLNLLEISKEKNVRFLLSSTSEVYGDPLEHPQLEDYYGNVNCFGPRACYDEGKRIAETLCYNFHKKFKIDIRIPRIFNTYGPKMLIDDGRVVTNFISRSLKNQNIEIYGDGEQTRSFCYIDDLIDGLLKIYFLDQKVLNEPLNIGNPTEFKIKDLAKLIIELTGSSSKIIYKKLPENDPLRRKPNIDKAKKLLNWEPKISLKEGLKKTINFVKKN